MDYTLKKTLTGGMRIDYACIGCGVPLHSSIEEAGRSDQCPECGTTFQVPGEEDRKSYEAQKAQEQAERRAKEVMRAREEKRLAEAKAAEQARLEQSIAAARQAQAEARRTDNIKIGVSVGGVICIVIGVVLLIVAFGMDTTVRDVHNIGLLNRQLMVFILGAVLLLSGFILDAANSIVINIRDTNRNQNHE